MDRKVVFYDLNKSLVYNLSFKNVKNINLRINEDGMVNVSAPFDVDPFFIDEFVLSKAKFIFSNLEIFEKIKKFESKPKKYVSGECFTFLGCDLMLKVIQCDYYDINCDGKYIYLFVKDDDNFSKKKNLVENWFKLNSITVFNEIANNVYKCFSTHDFDFPVVKIRKMKKRWGSCQPATGVVILNSSLIHAPRFCIEYVLMHEFCHFVHPNHSKDFYTLLQVKMPDWKERKNMLEKGYY